MIEERGQVLSVADGFAVVRTRRQSSCGTCAAQKGCGTALISNWFPQRQLRFRLPNDVAAKVGDTVVLGLEEHHLQRGALLLYAVPLVGLLGGAVFGDIAARSLGLSAELGSVALGLLGLTVALALVRRASVGRMKGGEGEIRLLRIAANEAAAGTVDVSGMRVAKSELGKGR